MRHQPLIALWDDGTLPNGTALRGRNTRLKRLKNFTATGTEVRRCRSEQEPKTEHIVQLISAVERGGSRKIPTLSNSTWHPCRLSSRQARVLCILIAGLCYMAPIILNEEKPTCRGQTKGNKTKMWHADHSGSHAKGREIKTFFFSVLWTDMNAYEKEKEKARRLN